jgi:hypothetical protein
MSTSSPSNSPVHCYQVVCRFFTPVPVLSAPESSKSSDSSSFVPFGTPHYEKSFMVTPPSVPSQETSFIVNEIVGYIVNPYVIDGEYSLDMQGLSLTYKTHNVYGTLEGALARTGLVAIVPLITFYTGFPEDYLCRTAIKFVKLEDGTYRDPTVAEIHGDLFLEVENAKEDSGDESSSDEISEEKDMKPIVAKPWGLSKAYLNLVLRSELLEFADGSCRVHHYLMEARCPENYIEKFRQIPTAQAMIVIEYIYSDQISFDSVTVVGILRLSKALEMLNFARPLAMCLKWMSEWVSMATYGVSLTYADENNMAKTKTLITNLIHKDFQNFIGNKNRTRSIGAVLFQELIATYLGEYEELQITVPDSTYESDEMSIFVKRKIPINPGSLIGHCKSLAW